MEKEVFQEVGVGELFSWATPGLCGESQIINVVDQRSLIGGTQKRFLLDREGLVWYVPGITLENENRYEGTVNHPVELHFDDEGLVTKAVIQIPEEAVQTFK